MAQAGRQRLPDPHQCDFAVVREGPVGVGEQNRVLILPLLKSPALSPRTREGQGTSFLRIRRLGQPPNPVNIVFFWFRNHEFSLLLCIMLPPVPTCVGGKSFLEPAAFALRKHLRPSAVEFDAPTFRKGRERWGHPSFLVVPAKCWQHQKRGVQFSLGPFPTLSSRAKSG